MDQPNQKRASKACDACKRRKVKCNGQERCQQCAHLGLRCVYSASGKQRSQGKRGHVISEFRKQTANVNATSPPLLPAFAVQSQFPTTYESATQSVESISGSLSKFIGTTYMLNRRKPADSLQLLLRRPFHYNTAKPSSWTSSQNTWKASIQYSQSSQNMSYGSISISWTLTRKSAPSSIPLVAPLST